MQRPHAAIAGGLAVVSQQITEFQRPKRTVLRDVPITCRITGEAQDFVDKRCPFIGGIRFQKRIHLFRTRQCSQAVEKDPPEKFRIGACRRRLQTQTLPLVPNFFVNETGRGKVGQFHRIRKRRYHMADANLPSIANHDCRETAAHDTQLSGRSHGSHAVVQAVEPRPSGDIASLAIAIVRNDP